MTDLEGRELNFGTIFGMLVLTTMFRSSV